MIDNAHRIVKPITGSCGNLLYFSSNTAGDLKTHQLNLCLRILRNLGSALSRGYVDSADKYCARLSSAIKFINQDSLETTPTETLDYIKNVKLAMLIPNYDLTPKSDATFFSSKYFTLDNKKKLQTHHLNFVICALRNLGSILSLECIDSADRYCAKLSSRIDIENIPKDTLEYTYIANLKLTQLPLHRSCLENGYVERQVFMWLIENAPKLTTLAMQDLLNAGLNPNIKGENEKTLLMDSSISLELAACLLKNGANPLSKDLKHKDPIEHAIDNNRTDLVDLFIKTANTKTSYINYAFYAIRNKKHEMVNLLLNLGVLGPIHHSSLLMIALNSRDPTTVKLLLSKGAAINYIGFQDYEPPIMRAVRIQDIDIVKTLLERGGDLNREYRHGESPLSIALGLPSSENTKALIKILLEHGANDSKNNYPMLSLLVIHHDVCTIKTIIDEFNPDFNKTDKLQNGQNTPLMEAIRRGSIPVIKLLLGYSDKIDFSIKNFDKKTAKDLALATNNPEIIALFS